MHADQRCRNRWPRLNRGGRKGRGGIAEEPVEVAEVGRGLRGNLGSIRVDQRISASEAQMPEAAGTSAVALRLGVL